MRKRPTRRDTQRPLVLAGAGAVAVAGACLGAWALLVEPRRLRVEEISLSLPGWPPVLDGLRVAVLADLHAGAPHVDEAFLERVVEKANATGTDLVTLLGDVVDREVVLGSDVPPEAVAARLGRLHAPLGVAAVLGNHDWKYDGERVRRALEEAGIRVLENDVAELRHHGASLWLAGFADAASGPVEVWGTLAAAPEAAPVLALTHSPDLFPRVPGRVALTLCGHTHGGQVNVPLVRRWAIPSRFGDRYAAGHVEEGGRHLFVHRGLGTSLLPLRFRAPPQIAVLTLASERGGPAPGDTDRDGPRDTDRDARA